MAAKQQQQGGSSGWTMRRAVGHLGGWVVEGAATAMQRRSRGQRGGQDTAVEEVGSASGS